MRSQRVILAMVLFGLLFSTISSAEEEEERAFGAYADRQMIASRTILLNDPLTDRITEIGNRVAQSTDRPDMKHTFRVINDSTIQACAAAGGFVYIYTGLLDLLESEDELAAVLAHEIAHTTRSHQINFAYAAHRRKVGGQVAGIFLAAALGVAAGMAAGPAPPVSSPKYISYQQQPDLVGPSMQLGLLMGDVIALCMIKGYGKDQELEADSYGIEYTRKAGYDPNAFVDVLKKFLSVRNRLGKTAQNYASSLLNAEPGLEQRITTAEKILSEGAKP